jgi:hypothetical protein
VLVVREHRVQETMVLIPYLFQSLLLVVVVVVRLIPLSVLMVVQVVAVQVVRKQ